VRSSAVIRAGSAPCTCSKPLVGLAPGRTRAVNETSRRTAVACGRSSAPRSPDLASGIPTLRIGRAGRYPRSRGAGRRRARAVASVSIRERRIAQVHPAVRAERQAAVASRADGGPRDGHPPPCAARRRRALRSAAQLLTRRAPSRKTPGRGRSEAGIDRRTLTQTRRASPV
jgi:hypothetical protein